MLSAAGLAALHVVPFAVVLIQGTHPTLWLTFAISFAVVSFGLTAGFHRYFAHRSFRTGRAFQFVLALMGAIGFGDPIAFSARHRLHHRHSDTDRDVHSPGQGFLYCWFGSLVDYSLGEAELEQLAPDLFRHREIAWIHRWFFVPGLLAALTSLLAGGWSALAGYCLGCAAVINVGSAVNYFGHRGSSRRFSTADRSANHFLLALVSLGEGWHNNHHYYPHACRAGFRWWEIDLLYYAIKLLSWVGVVWGLHEVPDHVWARQPAGGRR